MKNCDDLLHVCGFNASSIQDYVSTMPYSSNKKSIIERLQKEKEAVQLKKSVKLLSIIISLVLAFPLIYFFGFIIEHIKLINQIFIGLFLNYFLNLSNFINILSFMSFLILCIIIVLIIQHTKKSIIV
jgi:hypothetical protein